MKALKDVRAFARDELLPQELTRVDECIRAVERIVYRQ